MGRECAAQQLESVECSDEWIDELFQRLDSPRAGGGNRAGGGGRPSTPPDKEAANVAARVSAASVLAGATAGAFAAALPAGAPRSSSHRVFTSADGAVKSSHQ